MESESKVIRRENDCDCGATNSVKSATSVSMDGHGLTMTPLKQSAFFLFILSWIDVSEAGCHDYFKNDSIISLPEPVSYVNLPDKSDSITCTLLINSQKDVIFKYLLRDCYEQQENPNNRMCHGHTIHDISYHHFMCLTASVLKVQYNDCYSGDICLGPSSATTTRTIPPPTTTPTTTPTPTTTTTTPTPTTTTTTTPTPTTTVPERTSTAPPTTTPTTKKVMQSTVNRSSADHVTADKIYDIGNPTVSLLSISVMLNVVLLLLVIYLWMRQRRKELVVEINLNEPTSPQAVITTEEPNSSLQNHDLSYLINENEKPPVCDSPDRHSLLSGNDCCH